MKAKELRRKYLQFFKEKGHAIIPGASLVPEHDPTVLFTTAGMHPLVPFLLGEKHPAGQRLVNCQKCLRTGDIDKVGDSWHLTFFEMLGNWSVGDYWRKEAIEWSIEFLTKKKWLGIPKEKLSITVFAGDKDAPRDEESAQIWQKLGIAKERIYFLPKNENWWGPAGQTGPCGPCTEMFYDVGKDKCGSDCRPGCDCGKYVEIWNDVFMEYNKKIKMTNQNSKRNKPKNHNDEIEYEYVPLVQKNVDTGMGAERTVAILNGQDNVYEMELFAPIIKKIETLTNTSYKLPARLASQDEAGSPRFSFGEAGERVTSYRIIADHLKAATFILAENIEPSNVERGYVLRRLIRRAVRYGRQLGIKDVFSHKIAETVIDIYKEIYPHLWQGKDFISGQLIKEEEKFEKTLAKGLRELEKLVNKKYQREKEFGGEDAFYIYETFGFPLEMIEEELVHYGLTVNCQDFQEAFKKHQKLSRAGAEQKFKSGLADHSVQVIKYHTATHLLHQALREVLGTSVKQMGSNITPQRLRFDFSHSSKMTEQELKKVEGIVNQKIKEDLEVKKEEMSYKEAIKSGALAFAFKRAVSGWRPERVNVYSIGGFSKEICAGPHVKRTSKLGKFKIIKEKSSGAGIRRIRAILKS